MSKFIFGLFILTFFKLYNILSNLLPEYFTKIRLLHVICISQKKMFFFFQFSPFYENFGKRLE